MIIIYILIDILIDLATYPLNYPIVWLFFSWMVWLSLKLFKKTRPTASIMLIYSAAVSIVFVRGLQKFEACMRIELCAPYFELFPFLAEVAFWFVILCASITLQPGAILKSGKHGWLGLLAVELGAWQFIVELIGIINSLKTEAGVGIALQTLILWLLIPWLFWMLFIGLWQSPQPTARIMLMYSVSAILTCIRFSYDAMIDPESFSLISFLTQTVYWFVPLYALLKLVSKIETGNISLATS